MKTLTIVRTQLPSSPVSATDQWFIDANEESRSGHRAIVDPTNDGSSGPSLVASPRSRSPLISRLQQAAAKLPVSIPVGLPDGPFARFSGSPSNDVAAGPDAWEVLDALFNNVIGFGVTPEELANTLCRGPYGIDGLCGWLDICVMDLHIDEGLLEGKVECLISAIQIV